MTQTSVNKMAILAAAVCCSPQTVSVPRMHDEDVWPWPSRPTPSLLSKRTHSSSSCQGRVEVAGGGGEKLQVEVAPVEGCKYLHTTTDTQEQHQQPAKSELTDINRLPDAQDGSLTFCQECLLRVLNRQPTRKGIHPRSNSKHSKPDCKNRKVGWC